MLLPFLMFNLKGIYGILEAMKNVELHEKSVSEYERWLRNTAGDEAFHHSLIALSDEPEELTESFYKSLTFGTSGIRGILGPGTNRMNAYVIKRATMGLAEYLLSSTGSPRVVISYDNREKSEEFAGIAAKVLSAAGIKVYIFPVLTPVSVLSFAIRRLRCDGGIMITASHNPRIFNGYKVYNREGYQVTGKTCRDIQRRIESVDYFDKIPLSEENIEILDERMGELFKERILAEMPYNTENIEVNGRLKVVYTPLNGSGGPYVTDLLRRSGFKQVYQVPSQKEPDSRFITCSVPNPEKISAYNEAFKVLDEVDGDIIIATDPDADRVGAAIIHEGTKTLISGNQMGILMLDYLTRFKKIQPGAFIVRSIVSTPLVDKIAERNGLKVIRTLTGFKYIGEIISEKDLSDDSSPYYFGFEESCGFLASPFIRDKDGISSALLIAEMAAYYKEEGKDLMDRLMEIYGEYGPCFDRSTGYPFDGLEGEEKRHQIMEYFRGDHMDFDEVAVTARIDYLKDDTGLPKSDVIEITFDTGEQVIVRPSGTEPLIKIYLFVKSPSSPAALAVKKVMGAFQ